MAAEVNVPNGGYIMSVPEIRSSIWRSSAILLATLAIGLPLVLFLGSFVLSGLAILGPFVAINYLLWGL